MNDGLRRLTKHRDAFRSDGALIKLLDRALRNISKWWTLPIRDWKVELTRFTVQFEERTFSFGAHRVYIKVCTRSD